MTPLAWILVILAAWLGLLAVVTGLRVRAVKATERREYPDA